LNEKLEHYFFDEPKSLIAYPSLYQVAW